MYLSKHEVAFNKHIWDNLKFDLSSLSIHVDFRPFIMQHILDYSKILNEIETLISTKDSQRKLWDNSSYRWSHHEESKYLDYERILHLVEII